MRRLCSVAALSACLVACSNAGPLWEAEEISSLTELAQQFPDATSLIDQAGTTPVERIGDGYRLVLQPDPPSLDPRWHSANRGMVVTVSSDDPSSFEVAVPGSSDRLGVRRSAPLNPEAAVLEGAVHVRSKASSAEAFFFATEHGVEELLLVRDPDESITYDFDLPAGWTLRRAKGHRPIVEFLDPGGMPWARMIADRCWGTAGALTGLALTVQDTRVTLRLPPDAEGPVLVDPAWQYAGLLSDGRGAGVAVLLPSGKVLLAGGFGVTSNNASAELFDPVARRSEITGSMSVPRVDATATLLPNGTVLVAGGRDELPGALASAELYDPLIGEFSPTEPMAEPRLKHTATILDSGTVLMAGGATELSIQSGLTAALAETVELFDPATARFESTGSLSRRRSAHTATALPSGRVLIAGGEGLSQLHDSIQLSAAEVYEPDTGTFVPTGAMGQARAAATAVLFGTAGQVLVTGGLHPAGNGLDGLASAEVYDEGAGSFTDAAVMATARARSCATLLPDGSILVAGGEASATGPHLDVAEAFRPATGDFVDVGPMSFSVLRPMATMLPEGRVLLIGVVPTPQIYDPAAPNSEPTDDMTNGRGGHTATLLPDGAVLVVGGQEGAERFDAASGTFEPTAFPHVARMWHSATRLPDGQILLAGGHPWPEFTYGAPHASAELYDPSSEVFSAVGALLTARAQHTSTLLPDGRILLVGGVVSPGPYHTATPTAEVFDPETRQFSAVGQMATPRYIHSASLLPNGTVLVAGGQYRGPDSPETVLDSAEIFDPTSGQFTPVADPMVVARGYHSATIVRDGKVLLAAGAATNLPYHEIFDPATLQFQPLAESIPQRRFTATTTQLLSGKVLLAGGWPGSFGAPTDSLELFDPTSEQSVEPPGMTRGRALHSATLLRDGGVLLLGGVTSADGLLTRSAEIWHETPIAEQSWRAEITHAPERAVPGETVVIHGGGFEGVSEASGGPSPSPTNHPVAVWMPLVGAPAYGSIAPWSDEEGLWTVPSTAYPGPGLLFVVTNGIPSLGASVTISPTPLGSSCRHHGACASGHCTDGVCCELRCDQPCESCLASRTGQGVDGQCHWIQTGTDPDGDCDLGLACFSGQCRAVGCDGPSTERTATETRDCFPYRCSPALQRCVATCTSQLDCVEGYDCNHAGICQPAPQPVAPGCAPACRVGVPWPSGPPGLHLLFLGALWLARRRLSV